MMHDQNPEPAGAGFRRKAAFAADIACNEIARKEERLPFTIRLVGNRDELNKAVQVRHMAYVRHVPELGEKLKAPELLDYSSDTCVLLAESKLDGSPLGTARIQLNASGPLAVEQSVNLPARLLGRRLAEVTRLAVEGGRLGRLVKIALVKACFEYCQARDVDWAIAAGRAPIDRQYEELLFEDLFPERGFIPLKHAGDLPHRVMAFEIHTGHERWSAVNHPLLNFFSHTRHPDIQVATKPSFGLPHRVLPRPPAPLSLIV